MGSKGPSGNTTTTVQQANPTQQAQLPQLQDLWNYAGGLWQGYSPNIGGLQNYAQTQAATTAPLSGQVMPAATQQYLNQIAMGMPAQAQANQLTANAGQAVNQGLGYANALTGAANNAFGIGQNATNAIGGLAPAALAAGNPAEMGLNLNAGMALGNPALSSGLQGLASGAYINPSTNPAYAGMIQAATQPLVNQYMTATAPQVASQFEGAGRYGSGAATNAQGQAQYGLGQALGTDIAGITNNAYNTGLNATLGAGSALGSIYNQGISNITGALGTSGQLAQAGVQNAGNLLNQGYGTGLGYLNAGLSGLGAGAGAAQAGYGTANQALSGAGNLLNYGDIAQTGALSNAASFAGYPASQYTAAYNAPWLPLSDASSIFGGAVGGTGTTTSAQPYYSNTGANILGGLTGGLGIANTLGGAQGIFPGAISSALAFISDRRLKRDIRRIGALRNSLPIYSFRYVGSERMQVGLMADEVEQVHPEAVIAVGPHRIKMVDYAKAVQ